MSQMSYFYVFLDDIPDVFPDVSTEAARPPDSEKRWLDTTVKQAFEQFKKYHHADSEVTINPPNYDYARRYFGIKQLPAFAVSGRDLTTVFHDSSPLLKLPSRLKFWKRKERRKLLETKIPFVSV